VGLSAFFQLRRYFLKEYGSWGVMTLSFLTGIAVSGAFSPKVIPAFVAISFLINSKQALTIWSRSERGGAARHMLIFLLQIGLASMILLPILGGSVAAFLPYAAVPVVYVFLNRFAGEHAIYTETAGFASLALAAFIAKFLCTGQLDLRLYIAVSVFFCAGVFKVRVQLRKRIWERSAMALYLVFAVSAYYLIKAPLIALLPLADNLIFALTLYKIKLRATGWTEVMKGVTFLALMYLTY
jgi:hypothetical protein